MFSSIPVLSSSIDMVFVLSIENTPQSTSHLLIASITSWTINMSQISRSYYFPEYITVTSQITSVTVVYSTVYADVDQRKHQSSASLAFVEFAGDPTQMASNAEYVCIWWRHHGLCLSDGLSQSSTYWLSVVTDNIIHEYKSGKYLVSHLRDKWFSERNVSLGLHFNNIGFHILWFFWM